MTKLEMLLLLNYERYRSTNENFPLKFLYLHAAAISTRYEMVGEKTYDSSWPDPDLCRVMKAGYACLTTIWILMSESDDL